MGSVLLSPEFADTQPRWSNRPEPPKSEHARVSGCGCLPGQDAGGCLQDRRGCIRRRRGRALSDSLARLWKPYVGRAQLAVESLKAGSPSRPVTLPARKIAATVSQAQGRGRGDTLQDSREQVASRWFALKSVFARTDRDQKNDRQAMRESRSGTRSIRSGVFAGGRRRKDEPGGYSGADLVFSGRESAADRYDLSETTAVLLWGERPYIAGVVRTFSPPERKQRRSDPVW